MAKTAINALIVTGGATYTVPSAKYAILSVFAGPNNALGNINVNGVIIAISQGLGGGSGSGVTMKPICLNAADVLSCTGVSGTFGISGFEYDV